MIQKGKNYTLDFVSSLGYTWDAGLKNTAEVENIQDTESFFDFD